MKDVRVHARAGAALAALLALSVTAGSAYGAGAAPDISGTYWATQYNAKLQIVGGGDLPLTPEGKKALDMNLAGLKDGSITDAARKFCVPDGMPRVIAMDKPMQTYEQLVAFPFYNGHSTGRFEGDTLVVQTNGFNEKTFLDASGAPHTDMLVTTERIRKTGANQLEDVITIHDPMYYTKDFQVRFTYALRNEVRLEDYVCGEPHRDISGVRGVRRP
jgi:hypothetical protein